MPVYLFATFAAIACGPALYAVARGRPGLQRGLAALVWIGLLLLLGFEVMPEAIAEGGWLGAGWFVAGLAGPSVIEQTVRRLRRETHLAALAIAVAGLGMHALGDGAVLASVGPDTAALGAAVALHSLPIGLTLCWLLVPPLGWARAVIVLLAVCLATLAGYLATPDLSRSLGPVAWAWFQMLISGLLLHALLGRPHLHPAQAEPNAH